MSHFVVPMKDLHLHAKEISTKNRAHHSQQQGGPAGLQPALKINVDVLGFGMLL